MVERRQRGIVCAVAVHAVTVGYCDAAMRQALRRSTLVLPDGMPVVWAANLMGERLRDRVYGPELMKRYSQRCAERGYRVWLYGGRDDTALRQLVDNLRRDHAGIDIVGGYSPPFRPLGRHEEEARVGIGVPKQELWMARMRERLEVPVMCGVGAAFDFHGGRVSQAPRWMQQRGLEWIYRITQEPRRLLPRYLYYNPRFVIGVLRQYVTERRARSA
jgi:N-acetylglucosaminyldiphosphoundecaprenol N-acetyl-beta-D-mannosaminyltransferase